MSSFTVTPTLTQLSIIPRLWRLERNIRYYIGHEGSDEWVEALAGYELDCGSIPRAVWFIDAPTADGCAAYIIHDIVLGSRAMPRKRADEVMLEGLQVLGMGWTRRNIIYGAVRALGGFTWALHTEASIQAERRFIRTSFPLPDPFSLG